MIHYRIDEIASDLRMAPCRAAIGDKARNWAYAVRLVTCPHCRKWLKREGYL